jgi:hypothetical protein
LLRYLKQQDIDIPEEQVSHKVFLVNPHLTMDAAIAGHPSVLYRSKLSHPINHEAIINYCLAQETRNSGQGGQRDTEMRNLYSRIVDELDKLRSWDRIFLDQEDSWKGDIIQIMVGNDIFVSDNLVPGMTIEVHWPEDDTEPLLYDLLGIKPGALVYSVDVTYPISRDDTILFQKVGEKAPSRLPLTKIKKILIG